MAFVIILHYKDISPSIESFNIGKYSLPVLFLMITAFAV